MKHYLAVDFGGTQIRAARYGQDLDMEERTSSPTQAEKGREWVLRRIEEAVRRVWPSDGHVTAIGVAAPGPLYSESGLLLYAPNLPGWENVPLKERLEEMLGIPTFVGNDANLAALGEHRFGAGRGVDDLIYLTISTGIGGGIVVGGKLFEGGQGLGGEVGHIIVEADGPPCLCGSRGCLEALAAGPAIANAAREAIAEGRSSTLLDRVGGDPDRITAREVNLAAQEGDELSREMFERAGTYIGVALVSLMYLFNPSLFILGGSVTKAGDLLFEPIRRVIRDRAPEVYQQNTSIRRAGLGDDVGLAGAVAFAQDRAGED